jgi:transposase
MVFRGEGSRLRAELAEARAEVVRLRRSNAALRQQQSTDAAIIANLRRQVQTLEAVATQAAATLTTLEQQLVALQAQLATTTAQLTAVQAHLAATTLPPPAPPPTAPPDWVKPNTPARPPTTRRPRAPEHNQARRREEPTRCMAHQLDACPDCGTALTTPRLRYTRQVIEIPPPPPVEIVEHQVWTGYCPQCRVWHTPKLELADQVVGQGRIGVRLASLIAALRYQARLPFATIQALLADLWGVRLSHGGIVGVLRRLRQAVEPAFQALLGQARASPVLHMDETGWREDGDNGYIWEMATGGPHPIRLYSYDGSRAGAVMAELLGGQFRGVLVCDFYCGYNGYTGVIQRCWVHFLRDLRELAAAHRGDASVQRWVAAVIRLYRVGKEWLRQHPTASLTERAAAYAKLVGRIKELGLQYAQAGEHPCHTLAQRIMRHLEELFQYVRLPGVPADNNLAEQGVRGVVVMRKISGGSRSSAGTTTQMRLTSLVATWLARGQNPFVELLALLRQTTSAQTAPT